MAVINIKGNKWREEIQKAFDSFQAEADKEVEKRVLKWAEDLMEQAVLCRRLEPGAHNFTGNLLNSIVSGVYKGGKLLQAYYSSETGQVRPAIRRKMTSPRTYFFEEDYDYATSSFQPPVETDQGHGSFDARKFVMNYRPSTFYKDQYVIVVAYTTEYAEYTKSGFESAFMYAQGTGREYGFKLKSMTMSENVKLVTGFK